MLTYHSHSEFTKKFLKTHKNVYLGTAVSLSPQLYKSFRKLIFSPDHEVDLSACLSH